MAGIPSSKQSGSSAGSSPALIPQGHHAGKPQISLGRPVTLVGARHNAHLHLLSRQVSKAHALIINYDSRLYIRDLASRTHTYVNGKKIKEANLNPGDTIQIGSFVFKVSPKAKKHDGSAPRPPEMALDVKGGEMPIPIEQRVMLVGRRPSCDISLLEDSTSTAHAVIFELGGKRHIRDLGSRTGTFVNSKKVHQQVLSAGDVILIGETEMRYVKPAEPMNLDATDPVDELEHLVGTAPLVGDALDEVVREAAEERKAYAAREEEAQEKSTTVADDAPLEVTVSGTEADHDLPGVDEPDETPAGIEARVSDELIPETTPSVEPAPVDELDLDADPDVNAGPGDTRMLPVRPEPASRVPALSERVVDELPLADGETADEVKIDQEEPQLLVGSDLAMERLSSSATHTDLQSDADEAVQSAKQDPDETRTETDEPLAPVIPVASDDEIKPLDTGWEVEDIPEVKRSADVTAEVEPLDLALDLGEPTTELPAIAPLDLATPTDIDDALPVKPLDEVKSPEIAPLDLADEPPAAPARKRGGKKKTEPAKPTPTKTKATRKTTGSSPRRGKSTDVVPPPVEVLDKTEPTPDSAFALNDAVEAEPATDLTRREADLTDTGLGMIVSEFSSDSKEPIVQESAEAHDDLMPFTPRPADVSPAVADEHVAGGVDTLIFEEPTNAISGKDAEDIADAALGLDADTAIDEATPVQSVAPIVPEKLPAEEEEVSADIESALELDAGKAGDAGLDVVEEIAESKVDQETLPEPVMDEPEKAPSIRPIVPVGQIDAAYSAPASGRGPQHAPDVPQPIDDLPEDFSGLVIPEDEPVSVSGHEKAEPEISRSSTTTEDEFDATEPADHDLDKPDLNKPASAEAVDRADESDTSALLADDKESTDQTPGDFTFGQSSGHLGGMPLNLHLNEPPAEAKQPKAPAPVPSPQMPLPERPSEKTTGPKGPLTPPRPTLMPPPPNRNKPAATAFSQNQFENLTQAFASPGEDDESHPEGNRRGGAAHAFDGLAMGAMDNVDVFSQLPHPRSDDPVFGSPNRAPQVDIPNAPSNGEPNGKDAHSAREAMEPQAVQPLEETEQGTRSGRPIRDGTRLPPPQAAQTAIKPKKRRRFLGIPFLVFLMLGSLAVACACIYTFVHKTGTVQGKLQFVNIEQLTALQQQALEREMNDLVYQPETRTNASHIFASVAGEKADPGFLSDAVEYTQRIGKPSWSSETRGEWTLSVESPNVDRDRERVFSLLRAIARSGPIAKRRDGFAKYQWDLREAETAMAQAQRSVDQLQKEIEALRDGTLNGRTSEEQLAGAEAEVKNLETAWRAAKVRLADVEAELARLKAAEDSTAGDEPQMSPEIDNDPRIKQMEATLADLNKRLDKSRNAANVAADGAREALDRATAAFEKQIAELQSQMGGDPKLKAYVDAVRKLKEDVQQLTAELIQAQKATADAIMGLKRLIDDKVEARRQLAFQQDPALRELNDQLALKTRQLNAAKAGGAEVAAEAAVLEQEVALLQKQVKERQDAIGNDPVYAETIQQLKEIIEANQKRLDESRRRADELLASAERRFLENAPSVENLPAEQKAMAEALHQRVQEMNAARQAYTEAMAAKANSADADMKMLEEEIVTMRDRINSRRRELADAQHQHKVEQQRTMRATTIQQKEAEAEEARKAEAEADNAYTMKLNALREHKAGMTKLSERQVELEAHQIALKESQEKLTGLKANVVAYPLEPTKETAVAATELTDLRPIYLGGASAVILIVFSSLIVMAARQPAEIPEPIMPIDEFMEPALTEMIPPIPQPQPVTTARKDREAVAL